MEACDRFCRAGRAQVKRVKAFVQQLTFEQQPESSPRRAPLAEPLKRDASFPVFEEVWENSTPVKAVKSGLLPELPEELAPIIDARSTESSRGFPQSRTRISIHTHDNAYVAAHVVRQPGDGSCLFHALAFGLGQLGQHNK